MKQAKDGWRIVQGHRVYVDGGLVTGGVADENNGPPSQKTIYPYRFSERNDCWVKETPTLHTLRQGLRRGNYRMM